MTTGNNPHAKEVAPLVFANRRKRLLRSALVASLCLVVAGLVTSWLVASALVAPQQRAIGNPPSDLPAVSFTVDSQSGSVISGWHSRSKPSNGVVVLLHGIRGSRLSMLNRARMLRDIGYSTIMIDLQAHGESPGKQITVGHLERHDVRAAVEYARKQHPDERIGVIGVSLGGAAALLASPLNIDSLVLESVYPNIKDAINNRVSARLGPLSSIPSALLMIQLEPRLGVSPNELRPIDYIDNVGCPVFVVSGTADQHTTAAETRQMFATATEPKELWLVDGAAHADLFRTNPIQYRQRISAFLERHLRDNRSSDLEP